MFKDPFSPDHTQKLEDEWLRYFKENCKNPKMVSAFLLCWLICSLFSHYTNGTKIFKYQEIFRIAICLAGEKSEPGKAGDSPCAGESQG